MDLETLRLEGTGAVRTLRLNRPDKRNAMSTVMAREMIEVLGTLDCAVLVLTGDERAFSVGADLHDRGHGGDPGRAGWFEAFDLLSALPAVTIAAIEGWCLGGGLEMALCCDLRIAGEGARLGTPEITHDVFPAGGGTQRLPRIVGLARAKEMMLLGQRLPAAQAEQWNLVNGVVPDGEAHGEALRWGEFLGERSRVAVSAITELSELALDTPLRTGLDRERERLGEVLSSREAQAGVAAFRGRRSADDSQEGS